MPVSKDLVAASATPLVLAILRRGPSYGYAIIKEVEALSEGQLQWADGMLYPVLHRLEAQGFVESFWEAAETGRRRKYYRLREAGAAELERVKADWLAVHDTLARSWQPVEGAPAFGGRGDGERPGFWFLGPGACVWS